MKNKLPSLGLIAMNRKVRCIHCDKETTAGNIKKHEASCYMNLSNLQRCKVCDSIIKNYKTSKGTCSRSCANTFFKSGTNNPNWKGKDYQLICFAHHEKKCIVCGEDKIVAVHHYDHNRKNNNPKNLIPLCPTHHCYVHSQYANEVLPYIEKYRLGVG